MIALQTAHYLGRVDQFRQSGGLTASVTSYPDIAYAENMHYHQALHTSLVLQGGNLEKRKTADIERLPGTLTWYDAGEWHQSTRTRQYSKSVNLEISAELLGRHELKPDLSAKEPGQAALLLKIYRELLTGDQDSDLSLDALVLQLLGRKESGSSLPDWAKPVRELLYDHWRDQLSLDTLALAAGIHPVHLSAAFSKYFGDTLGAYRRKLRVERALTLVTGTEQSLTAIAFDCGFADQSHFIRAFREQTGWLPKQLRRL